VPEMFSRKTSVLQHQVDRLIVTRVILYIDLINITQIDKMTSKILLQNAIAQAANKKITQKSKAKLPNNR